MPGSRVSHGRIHQEGTVLASGGTRVVRFGASGGNCSACGACEVGSGRRAAEVSVRLLGPGSPATGTRVDVSVAVRGLNRVALVLFGLPLAMLLTGALLGAASGVLGDVQLASVGPTVAAPLAAGVGLVLALAVVRRRGARLMAALDLRCDPARH